MSGKIKSVGSFLPSWLFGHVLDIILLGGAAGAIGVLFARFQELAAVASEHPVVLTLLTALAFLVGATIGYGYKDWQVNKSGRALRRKTGEAARQLFQGFDQAQLFAIGMLYDAPAPLEFPADPNTYLMKKPFDA